MGFQMAKVNLSSFHTLKKLLAPKIYRLAHLSELFVCAKVVIPCFFFFSWGAHQPMY